jgi:uncharacterized protein
MTSKGGNNYFASRSIPQVLLLHPVLKYLLELKEKGKLKEWLNRLPSEGSSEIRIENGGYASKKKILYYYRYMQFLENKGYFERVEKFDITSNKYSAQDVVKSLANSRQIVFEVTESCNLKCKYCGYGELYAGFDKRENRSLDLSVAKKVLDYMTDLYESPLNRKYHKKIAISFYGGEPLLNMPFIKEMVRYANLKKITHKRFYYSMTTNGILLDRHMDFLAANDFLVLISLDGDEKNNGHRNFPDGTSSFDIVYNSILKLRQKYPGYFKKSVSFISVIHDKNSNKEVREYFKREFQKTPLLIEVNKLGIKPERRADYEKLFKNIYSGLTPQDIIAETNMKDGILRTPFVKMLWNFLRRYSGFVFNNYDGLIHKATRPWFVCTGTCDPFGKKVFVTTNGRILPCERILQSYSLGSVDKDGVHLNFEKIAATYNRYYGKLMSQCNKCSDSDGCPHCIFTLNLDNKKPVCNKFMKEREYKDNLNHQLSMLEETPQYYTEIMKNYQVN